MPKPAGESHHAAQVTLRQASRLKKRIANGATVREVATSAGLEYQMVYRLATGKTWATAPPEGSVIGLENRDVRGPKRGMKLGRQYILWRKRRDGIPTAKLASGASLSPSSVRRLISEFDVMLAARVSQLQLTSGSYAAVKRKYGIGPSEAESLDQKASQTALPERLQRIVDRDFPRLEKKLNGGST